MPDFSQDLQSFQQTVQGGTKLPRFIDDVNAFRSADIPDVSRAGEIELQTEAIKAQKPEPVEQIEEREPIQDIDLSPPETAEQSAVLSESGRITQRFGQKSKFDVFSGGVNYGTDIAVPEGTTVAAPPGDWEVVDVFDGASNKGFIGNKVNSGYGNSVLIRNQETGEMIRMSHLSPGINLKSGQKLAGGQVFARTGSSGNVTGAHLDAEFYNSKGKLSDIERSPYWGSFVGASGGGDPESFFKKFTNKLGLTK